MFLSIPNNLLDNYILRSKKLDQLEGLVRQYYSRGSIGDIHIGGVYRWAYSYTKYSQYDTFLFCHQDFFNKFLYFSMQKFLQYSRLFQSNRRFQSIPIVIRKHFIFLLLQYAQITQPIGIYLYIQDLDFDFDLTRYRNQAIYLKILYIK